MNDIILNILSRLKLRNKSINLNNAKKLNFNALYIITTSIIKISTEFRKYII